MTGFKDSIGRLDQRSGSTRRNSTWIPGCRCRNRQIPLAWRSDPRWRGRAPAPGPTPMQQWTKLFGASHAAGRQAASTRLFDLGKSYMNMGETFWHLLQQGKDFDRAGADWLEALKNAFAQFGKAAGFTGQAPPIPGPASPPLGFAAEHLAALGLPFSPFPGEMEKALRPEDGAVGPSDMTTRSVQMLSMPPVGYTREWQEQAQEWAQPIDGIRQGDAGVSLQLLGKVSQRAPNCLQATAPEQLEAGNPSTDCARPTTCGSTAARTPTPKWWQPPDFPHLQAQMVNALMRLKRHEQAMMDEVMTALNMPTRRRAGHHPPAGTRIAAATAANCRMHWKIPRTRRGNQAHAARPCRRTRAGRKRPQPENGGKTESPQSGQTPCPTEKIRGNMMQLPLQPDQILKEALDFNRKISARHAHPAGSGRRRGRRHAERGRLPGRQAGSVPLQADGRQTGENAAADRLCAGQPALHDRPAGGPLHRPQSAGPR